MPRPRKRFNGQGTPPKLFVIPQFLTLEECETFIERSEQLGYADAPINTSFGPLVRT